MTRPDTSGPTARPSPGAISPPPQADVNAGSIRNTGTATGKPPSGANVSATSSVTIPAVQSPALTVVKSATQASFSSVGQSINYSYLVINTGNVTMSSIAINDARTGFSAVSCPNPTLAPAASKTCAATSTTQISPSSRSSFPDPQLTLSPYSIGYSSR